MFRTLSFCVLALGLSLPAAPARGGVEVSVAGNTAHADITLLGLTLAELTLAFDDAENLTPGSIGISARLVSPNDPLLRLRLPQLGLQTPLSALPLLLTVEPPASGALAFRNTVRVEVHTDLLPYTAGSSFRLFKAPLLGPFRDITDEVAPGSVRTRGTTGGFSQFLILLDLRPSDRAIDEKLDWMRARSAGLAPAQRDVLHDLLDETEAAVLEARFADAIASLDELRAYVSTQAGSGIPNRWSAAARDGNVAGDLLGGASSLKFSVAFLRDYGR